MTNEEMRRTMEFIVNQQALFAADIQKLQESQQHLQESQQYLLDSQQRLQESQQKMNESRAETIQLLNRLAAATVKGFEDTSAKINALIDAQIRTDEKLTTLADAQTRTDEKLSTLADAQTKTDGAVRNLTSLVERYFDGRKNGG